MKIDTERLERIESLIGQYNRFGNKKDKKVILKKLKKELNENLSKMRKSKEVIY